MSTQEDVNALEREREDNKDREDKDNKDQEPSKESGSGGDAEMKDADVATAEEEKEEDILDPEILQASTQDINMRRRLLENELRIVKSEHQRLTHEKAAMNEKIKDNLEKIENNR